MRYRRAGCCVLGSLHEPVLQVSPDRWIKLQGPSARIWQWLEYPITLDELCERLGEQFIDTEGAIVAHTARFLEQLVSRGVAQESTEPRALLGALQQRYLYQVKRGVLNLLYPEHEVRIDRLLDGGVDGDWRQAQRALRDVAGTWPLKLDQVLAAKWNGSLTSDRRVRGHAHTQVGLLRLDNIERCAEAVFADRVEGDFLEAGVCQGGAAIFMRALQVAHGQERRCTWLADSFLGVPPPTAAPDVEAGLDLSEARQPWLACGRANVTEHFRRYDLLGDKVRFLEGFFADSLPSAPVGPLSILRIDADLYSSTSDVLRHLYDRVVPGGFVIVDDYGALTPCRQAVDEFRAEHQVTEPLQRIDWTGVFWRRGA
jgi:O-methyltransferase